MTIIIDQISSDQFTRACPNRGSPGQSPPTVSSIPPTPSRKIVLTKQFHDVLEERIRVIILDDSRKNAHMDNVKLLHQVVRDVVEDVQYPHCDIVWQILGRREVIGVDVEALELPGLGTVLSDVHEPASALGEVDHQVSIIRRTTKKEKQKSPAGFFGVAYRTPHSQGQGS